MSSEVHVFGRALEHQPRRQAEAGRGEELDQTGTIPLRLGAHFAGATFARAAVELSDQLAGKALALGGYRVPEFDLEIAAQDETPYKTMEYNQLALQLFQMGFFRADMAEQALRCLELMEFKNKDQLASVIRQGQQRTRQVAWLQRQLLTAVQLLDAKQGTSLAQALEQEMNGGEAPGVSAVKAGSAPDTMERQRKQSREAVRPR